MSPESSGRLTQTTGNLEMREVTRRAEKAPGARFGALQQNREIGTVWVFRDPGCCCKDRRLYFKALGQPLKIFDRVLFTHVLDPSNSFCGKWAGEDRKTNEEGLLPGKN